VPRQRIRPRPCGTDSRYRNTRADSERGVSDRFGGGRLGA